MKSFLTIVGVFLIISFNVYLAEATNKKSSIKNLGSFLNNHYAPHDIEEQMKVTRATREVIVDQKIKQKKINLISKKNTIPSINHGGDENGEISLGITYTRNSDPKISKSVIRDKTELLQMKKVSQKFQENTYLPKMEKVDSNDVFIYESNDRAVLDRPALKSKSVDYHTNRLLRRK